MWGMLPAVWNGCSPTIFGGRPCWKVLFLIGKFAAQALGQAQDERFMAYSVRGEPAEP
jgi:hypothetical protein